MDNWILFERKGIVSLFVSFCSEPMRCPGFLQYCFWDCIKIDFRNHLGPSVLLSIQVLDSKRYI